MRSPRPPRGITLVETLVAMGVTAIVLVAVIAAASSQQRAFHGGQRLRSAQGSARAALLYLEQKVPLAGWGMDPALAFDFQYYGCPASPAVCSRDRTGDADELVFYARNPMYWVPEEGQTGTPKGRAWTFVGISGLSAKVTARAGDVFPKGQIYQVVCPGELKYAYFTVGATKKVTAPADVDLALVDQSDASPFLRQDVAAGYPGCRMFQIDRFRFYVRPVALGGDRYDPYLFLDTGTDLDGDGEVEVAEQLVIAEGIEALQVAYVFANPALGAAGDKAATPVGTGLAEADQSVSATLDVAEKIALTNFPGAAPASGETKYAPSSFFRYRYADARRQTSHQANIRAVRVALVARSPEPDSTQRASFELDSGFALLNQAGAPAWITTYAASTKRGTDGYQRVTADATITLPNMVVRSITAF
jgi:type IV pilus assembly protein PilW